MEQKKVILTKEEEAILLPFHEFMQRKRAELDRAEQLLIEHIMSSRKVQYFNESVHTAAKHATEQPSAGAPDDASSRNEPEFSEHE